MSSGSIIRYLDLHFDEADDPGVPAELRYNFTNSASNTWMLARIKAFQQSGFGGELAFETNTGTGTPGDTTTERMRIDHNGNVGIGKPNPSFKLDVQGVINADDIYKNGAPLSTSQWTNVTGGIEYSGGNVGIGTATPANKLDVNGDIAIQGKHAFRGNDAWLRLNQDGAFPAGVHTPGVFAPVSLNVGGAGGWGNPGSGNVWITGNVGIGTNTPGAHLEIKNPWSDWIFLRQQRSTEGDGRFHIHNPWGDTHGADRNRLEIAYRTAAGQDLWGQFVLHGPSGNVGIGTGEPKSKLHVAANAGVLNLEGQDHAYIQWYPSGFSAGRKAWMGYGNAGTTAFTIQNDAGRMHIYGAELLYLLNKDGVIIGKEWGGSGNLSVEGNLSVNGQFVVNSPSGNRLIMQGDGNLVIYRSNGAAWWNSGTNVSDIRLKKDIRPIERPLEKLLSVTGISFSWVEDGLGSERQLGVLADEVEKAFPELVCSLDKKYKSVKYQGLIAVLIKAIKEQQATILRFGEELQVLRGMLKPHLA